MAFPLFNSIDLNTSNYITTEVEYRTIPNREINLEPISRKPGKKYISNEFGERRIKIIGFIIGSSTSDLQTKIDDLNTGITRVSSGTLSFDSSRSITATLASLTISDPQYSQTMVPFEMEFVAAAPFFEGTQQTANTTVVNAATSKTITTTISGSVFAEPNITFTATAGAGYTTTSGITVTYSPTSEYVTWSGGANFLAKGSSVQFDYANLRILQDATEVNSAGAFSRWEPGSTTFVVAFGGATQGGVLSLVYKPRYL